MDGKMFYAKKLGMLKQLNKLMQDFNVVYNRLVELEDSAPCGDSQEEYSALFVAMSELDVEVFCLLDPTAAMVSSTCANSSEKELG